MAQLVSISHHTRFTITVEPKGIGGIEHIPRCQDKHMSPFIWQLLKVILKLFTKHTEFYGSNRPLPLVEVVRCLPS